MKKALMVFLLVFSPLLLIAQDKNYYIYQIVTFDSDFDKEGLKVKIDNGKTVEKFKNANGSKIKFKTPAAALMFFISEGWDLYITGGTTTGGSFQGTGGTSTTSYWIFRKPCSKEIFEKSVEEGIKK